MSENPEATRTCQWSYMDWPESASDFETECGAAWTFTDGGLTENGALFCMKCGGRIIPPVPPVDDEDEADDGR